jgi:hypothetical protein
MEASGIHEKEIGVLAFGADETDPKAVLCFFPFSKVSFAGSTEILPALSTPPRMLFGTIASA